MTENQNSLSERISERFPEGLTGVFALGGTRTAYILSENRGSDNPGKIEEFGKYVEFSLQQVWRILSLYFVNGGQNLIVAVHSYQGFYDRGQEYSDYMLIYCQRLIDQQAVDYYHANNIDPYFIGIDTLLNQNEDSRIHEFGAIFAEFQAHWDYQPGRKKLIWEVAPIPLFSFWKAAAAMPTRIEEILAATSDLRVYRDELHRYFSNAVYNTDLPIPHFYLGNNRNGDMKLRAVLPISLLCGDPFRLFYTPYPSFFLSDKGVIRILEDLVTDTPGRSFKTDYAGRISPEAVEQEYQRIITLAEDTNSIVGLHYTHPQQE